MEVLNLTCPPIYWEGSIFMTDTLTPLHTSSSDAPAFCSLYSKAASSPIGLCWPENVCCSYSTHRLLSESPAAGNPKEICVGRKAYQKARILPLSYMVFTQPHTPLGFRLRLGTCTSKLMAFLVESEWLDNVASLWAASPSLTLEVTA